MKQIYSFIFLLSVAICLSGCEDMHPNSSGYLLGDSTVAAYLEQSAVYDFITTTVDSKQSLAVPNHTIEQQKAAWHKALYKKQAKYIVIQIGLNDLGNNEPAADVVERMQELVDLVKKHSSENTAILISQMIPCKQRLIDLYGSTKGEESYKKWQAINEAIAGNGPTTITGVDGRVTTHVALMRDDSDNLNSVYDMGDGIHPNNAGRKINAQAIEEALSALGVR